MSRERLQEAPTGTEQSRRTFLRSLGIFCAGLLGMVAGGGIWRILTNELKRGSVLSEEVLLGLIHKQAQSKVFGLYPDFEHPEGTPWADLESIHQQVIPTEYVGTFARLDTFESAEKTDLLLEQLFGIYERHAIPVVSLGADLPPEYRGKHTFHPDNLPVLEKLSQKSAQILDAYPGELIVRLFYEPQVPYFGYGPQEGFSGARHAYGFQQAFSLAAEAFAQYRNFPTKIAFAPWVERPSTPYFPKRGKKVLADLVGLDGYDLYPGDGNIKHENYWVYGNRTPEEVFLPALAELHTLTKGKIPTYYWEIGSYTRDPEWIRHAALLLFAVGGTGLMHFNYDKRRNNLPWETDWRMNEPLQRMYRQLWHDVQTR